MLWTQNEIQAAINQLFFFYFRNVFRTIDSNNWHSCYRTDQNQKCKTENLSNYKNECIPSTCLRQHHKWELHVIQNAQIDAIWLKWCTKTDLNPFGEMFEIQYHFHFKNHFHWWAKSSLEIDTFWITWLESMKPFQTAV